jgi:hypothetical protein
MYRVEALYPDLVKAPPPREFRTAAGLLRWAIKEGAFGRALVGNRRAKDPGDIYLYEERHPGRDYHTIDSFFRYRITPELMDAMYRAWKRWSEIVYYLREVEPEWVEGKETRYADNSVGRTDTNKYGKTRRVMLKHPSGDACF